MVRKIDGKWETVKLVSFCKTSRTNTQSCARDLDSKGISTSKQKYWKLFLHHWFSYLKILKRVIAIAAGGDSKYPTDFGSFLGGITAKTKQKMLQTF